AAEHAGSGLDLLRQSATPQDHVVDAPARARRPARDRLRALGEPECGHACQIGELTAEVIVDAVEVGAVVVDLAEALLARHPRGAYGVIRAVHAAVVVLVVAVERLGHDDEPPGRGKRSHLPRELRRQLTVAVTADP